MSILLAFGVHVGDMALGPRPKMEEWTCQLNNRFAAAGLRASILCWFRQTGNFAVDAGIEVPVEVRKQMVSVTGASWLIVSLAQLEKQIKDTYSTSQPPAEPRIRWTRGVALRLDSINPPRSVSEPWITAHGVFEPVNDQVVQVWKRDPLTEGNTLERTKRPPWGTISRDCSNRFGGVWTARSLSTLEGLVSRARECLSTEKQERPFRKTDGKTRWLKKLSQRGRKE